MSRWTAFAATVLSSGTATGQIELTADPGYVPTAGQAINVVVTVGSGTCLKGAEVHYIAHPDPTATSLRTGEEGTEPGLAQDGAPATAGS
jgi:hypothetical protein